MTAGCGAIQAQATTGDDDVGSGAGSGSSVGSGSGSAEPAEPGPMYGSVLDERNDVIDFASHAPIHTHGGAPIDLGSGCPAIYKYAYLEGALAPRFGSETAPNPLAWHIASNGAAVDPTDTAYRVRDDAGHVLLDWTAMTPDAGIFTIELRRDGTHSVPAIATQASRMYVDARFRDTAGTESIETACWDNHPLAAPLEITAPTSGDLFPMSFANHSHISRLMNIGSPTTEFGPTVAQFSITQDTAEPTTLYLASTTPTGTGTKDVVDEYVLVTTYPDPKDCGASPCATVAPPVPTTGDSPINGVWTIYVIGANGVPVCQSTAADPYHLACTIPARSGAPVTYAVELQLSGERSIAPAVAALGTSTFIDLAIADKWISGTADTLYTQSCSTYRRVFNQNGDVSYVCSLSSDYTHVSAVNRARIAFDPIQFTAKTAVGDTTTALTLPYLTPLVWPAETWDSGSAGL